MAVNAKYWRCTILHADNQTRVEYQRIQPRQKRGEKRYVFRNRYR